MKTVTNLRQIKSDYDYWNRTDQQLKFDSEFNSWFSHFQMNDNNLPEFNEGNRWWDKYENTAWMGKLQVEFDNYPVSCREIAAFYQALKSVGAINENGQPLNNSRQITSATTPLKISNVTVFPKWIAETSKETIYVGANINGKDFVFPMMPCYGNTVHGVDCNECLVTKLNGGWGGHADYDRNAQRINHVAKGGSSKAYGLNIMYDVLKSAPKENQKDFSFTGQYYSTKNVPRAFKSKLLELYDNGSLEPEFLNTIGFGQIKSSVRSSEIKEGNKFKNPNGVIIEIVKVEESPWDYVCYRIDDGYAKDTTISGMVALLVNNDYELINSSRQIKSSKFYTSYDRWKDNTAVLPVSKSTVMSFFEDGSWSWDNMIAIVGSVESGRIDRNGQMASRRAVIFGAGSKYSSIEKGTGLFNDQSWNDIGYFTFSYYSNDDSVFDIPNARYFVLK